MQPVTGYEDRPFSAAARRRNRVRFVMSLRRLVALVATLIGLAALPAVAEPDFYAVTGVASNDVLNVRAGPSAGDRIVGALANGQVVRDLGCRTQGNSRWCRIQQLDDMRSEGWVNARYLRESGPPR